ncbi:MAG: pilin [Minisyncoccota bacterium]
MRFRVPSFMLLFVAGSFALPFVAHAGIPFFGPIIPPSYSTCPAGWGMIMDVINNIIALAITLAIVFIAPIMIAYSGFLLVVGQGNPGEISKAKGILLNTIVGIVIALAGWLIVDAVMAVLYNPAASSGTTVLGTWSSLITSSGGTSSCLTQTGSQPNDTLNQAAPTGITAAPATGNEQAIRQRFANAGVSINNSPCTTGSSGSGCTNVNNMQEGTVAEVIALASACSGCSLTITGGTEPGHASGQYSHGTGYKVDLRLSTALDSYLQSMTSKGTRMGDSPGPAYADACGNNLYVRESDHWDIVVYAFCPRFKK